MKIKARTENEFLIKCHQRLISILKQVMWFKYFTVLKYLSSIQSYFVYFIHLSHVIRKPNLRHAKKKRCTYQCLCCHQSYLRWAPSSEFVSSSIPSWQISTAHAQPFRGARDLVFCLKVPLDSLLVWVSSGGSGGTARMRRLAWTFATRIGDKYQIRLTRPRW